MGELNPSPPAERLLGDEVEVLINKGRPWFVGEAFSDWMELEIHRSLSSAAGAFKIKAAHQRPWPMRPDVDVTVTVASGQVMTGFVDSLKSGVAGEKRSLSFAGRDNTATLVDCSALNEPGEWRGLTIRKILEEICKPFGIEVSAAGYGDLPADVIPIFKLQPGERAWTAIERAIRLRGYLAYAYGDGTLRLARAGQQRAATHLVEGTQGNILSSEITWSHANRFSRYLVRGQSSGSDDGWGAAVFQPEGLAEDPEVLRDRPLLVLAEGQISVEAATTRAEWEASFRASRAARLKITVAGWTTRALGDLDPDEEREIWRVNQTVPVTIPSQGFENRMLIDDVVFKRSATAGTTTELTLVRLNAYDPKPKVTPAEEPFSDFLGELK